MKKRVIMLSILLVICVLTNGCSSPSGNLIQPNAQAELERKYACSVMELISSQFEIMTEETRYFKLYTNDMDNKAYCAYFKIAYDDTKENHNRLVSLNVPPTLQSQHEMLLSYFKNNYKSYLAKYNWCMSEIYSNQRSTYSTEMLEYSARGMEDWMEFTVWIYELKEKDPEKCKMWTEGPNPLLSIPS